MKLNKPAAALAAGAILLAIPTVATPASASTYAGSIYWGHTTGIPGIVHRGQTITVTLWVKQISPYVLAYLNDRIDLYNPKGVNKYGASAPGVTLAWQDPITKRWMPNDLSYSKGSEDFFFPSNELKIASGVWSHINVRITFNKTVPLGTWHISGVDANSYTLFTKTGRGGGSAMLKPSGIYVQPITVVR